MLAMEEDLERMEDIGPISGQNEKGDNVCIQILANSIKENLGSLNWAFSSENCIYRVPETLRRVNESAYTPKLVSIGPFHRNNKTLGKMEVHKQRYLQTYLHLHPNIQLNSFLEALWGLEERARQCYAEHINLDKFQFVEMMLLDGFFIIEFLLKYRFPDKQGDDPIFKTMWMPCDIHHDLILLENQLPFFVLEHLFNLVSLSNQEDTPPELFRLILHFFDDLVEESKTPDTNRRSEAKHILDLVRSCCIPPSLQNSPIPSSIIDSIRDLFRSYCISSSPPNGQNSVVRHSVTELHEAGVKFKADVSESNYLLGVKFTNRGILEIKPLRIEDGTESFFRNLIALEQCHYSTYSYVTSYAVFMDRLINTPKDVDLLIRNEIIENYLGSHGEVSSFINSLAKDVVIDEEITSFKDDYYNLDKYCKKRRHKWMTSLRRTHFQSPWAIISFFTAALLIILTLIQTVCSIIAL